MTSITNEAEQEDTVLRFRADMGLHTGTSECQVPYFEMVPLLEMNISLLLVKSNILFSFCTFVFVTFGDMSRIRKNIFTSTS